MCLCMVCIKLFGAVEIVNSVDDVMIIFIFIFNFRFVCGVILFDFSSCGGSIEFAFELNIFLVMFTRFL